MEECKVQVTECDKLKSDKERGASLVEYAVLVGIILTIAIGGLQFFGSRVASAYNRLGQELTNNVP